MSLIYNTPDSYNISSCKSHLYLKLSASKIELLVIYFSETSPCPFPSSSHSFSFFFHSFSISANNSHFLLYLDSHFISPIVYSLLPSFIRKSLLKFHLPSAQFSLSSQKISWPKSLSFSYMYCYSSPFITVQFSRSVVSDSLWPHGLWHDRPPRPSPTPRVYSNSCALSWWCHPTISSSVFPFSSCLQSFLVSWSFQMSQFFVSGGQSIGVSASASVLPMNTQEWSPLGWTGWISLQVKGLLRVFSNTTVQKHQFFSAQISL